MAKAGGKTRAGLQDAWDAQAQDRASGTPKDEGLALHGSEMRDRFKQSVDEGRISLQQIEQIKSRLRRTFHSGFIDFVTLNKNSFWKSEAFKTSIERSLDVFETLQKRLRRATGQQIADAALIVGQRINKAFERSALVIDQVVTMFPGGILDSARRQRPPIASSISPQPGMG